MKPKPPANNDQLCDGHNTDTIRLLHLLADIRAAAGDREGKLMQSELVSHIAELRKKGEAATDLPRNWQDTVYAVCEVADSRGLPDHEAVSIGVWDRTAAPKKFHAIIRYNVSDFRKLAGRKRETED